MPVRAGEPVLVTGPMLVGGRGRPEPSAVLLTGGRVRAVGPAASPLSEGARRLRLAADEVGLAGFADPHLHLLATAAARLSVDCSPAAAPTVADVLDRLSDAAALAPPDTWLRGAGFDEALVGDHRLPTVAELDRAVPGHPLVLHHATGHAALLNTRALRALGAPDAEGLLVRRHDLLARVPRLNRAALDAAVLAVGAELWAAGVVAFTDATHTNGPAEVDHLAGLADRLPQEVTVMAGWDRLGGLRFGERRGRVTIGPAKVLLMDGLADAVAAAHAAGFPVAVHAVDVEELARALDAVGRSPAPVGTRDRVEHCALALPEQVEALARLGVEVVTQPSFALHRAAKYRRELTELEHTWLWRLRSLLDAGVPVRLSSDSPVVPARPLDWLAAAVDRPVGAVGENLDRDTALGLAAAGPVRPGAPFLVVGPDSVRYLTDSGH